MNNTNELRSIAPVDLSQIPCKILDDCTYKERSLSYALGVVVPTAPVDDVVEQFKECCYVHRVFADTSSNEDFKNDYSGFYYQRELTNETASFELIDVATNTAYDLNDNTYGQFFAFGAFDENTNFSGYRVDWKKVLTVLGPGSYQVKTTTVKIGITTEVLSYVFTLSQYTPELADKTVRIDIVQNGLLEKTGVDFTGLGWAHSLRVGGFFGRRNPQFEEDNIIRRDFENQQISMNQTNEYRFQTSLIPDCISFEIFDFILMANDIYFNDYNSNNHTYTFQKFPVKLSSNEEPVYSNTSRSVQLNMLFNDKFLNNLKRNFK